ncbi:SLC13 family permease [Engelhardtia mirabilis]|uniref:Sodium-dependent dicarboxylate transporter SdcS n=1 Tax=Engelhardtia mirabilis TaxID=2528011 RepID=A0A518BLL1_9BACT|nr:Sodium-dependent dicarboxylate transporter SdcS [Planctomycetes bacterium Pla133]QDV02181.1 Sodium-dependent dicarboxylate transporter SdcS [Planctomycetes bacterium Pla86]
MGPEAILVLLLLVSVLLALALTKLPPDGVLITALTVVLGVPFPVDGGWRIGLLEPSEALAGFANPGVVTIGLLFMVVAGLRESGAIDWIAERVLGRPASLRAALIRMIVPVSTVSAFLNNTPVVAMLIPALGDWSKRLNLRPSKLMIPLSYAAILGGLCSLIGTSTNLVVSGLVLADTEMTPLGMFDVTSVGLPCAVIGGLYLVLFGPRLLPDRGSAASALADPREYTLEMIVPESSALVGKSIEEAGLRNLPGCFLVEIERGDQIIAPVLPDQGLMANDRLLFAGIVESIKELQNQRGLALATNQVFKLDSPRYRRRLYEAVVSQTCPLAGRTIREGKFRSVYGAAIIAVARNGERIRKKIGDIILRPGDTLLIEAGQDFGERQRNSRDFYLVSAIEDSTPRRHSLAPVALGILVGMVGLATFTSAGMLVAAAVAALAMVVTRCCSWSEARRGIDWSTLLVIGSALGLGRAMDRTGGADAIANTVMGLAGSSPWLTLAAVYLVTAILTETITNSAAVAIAFPIAHAAADELGVSFMPFVIAIMIAGSASFATPLGYQTNLMVYGPGGYRFGDFFKIGIPLTVIVGVIAVTLAPMVYPFFPS